MKFNYWKISSIGLLFIVLLIPILHATDQNATKNQQISTFIPVLCYHRVIAKISSPYDLTPAMLEKHFQLFKKEGFHPITAQQYFAFLKQPALFPPKPMILSFDDGNKSQYQNVLPLLKKYGFLATFFVFPNAVSKNTESNSLITWSELSEIVKNKMDIECHSLSHPILTNYKLALNDPHYLAWLDHEFKDSKAIIEQKLNIKVNSLAYPYGWYNSVVEAKAIEAGYQGVFTVNWGTNLAGENPFSLKRKVISNTLKLNDLDRYINSKPMAIDIISPQDAEIDTQTPVIKFKLRNQQLKKITMVIRTFKYVLSPDNQGIITFDKLGVLKPGFYMIILSGYDDKMNYYMNSWGFDYRNPEVVKVQKPLINKK